MKQVPMNSGEGEETEAEVVEYSPADSLKAAFDANDSGKFNEFLTQAKAKIDELKDTDPATAKKYLEAVQTFLKEQGDAITKFVGGNATVATLVKEVSELKLPDVPGEVKDAVDVAAEEAKEAAEKEMSKQNDPTEQIKKKTVKTKTTTQPKTKTKTTTQPKPEQKKVEMNSNNNLTPNREGHFNHIDRKPEFNND